MSELSNSMTTENSTNPRDAVRAFLDRSDLAYEEEDGNFFLQVCLTSVEGTLICSAESEQLFAVTFRFPTRVSSEMRPSVGEFLHRVNYPAARMCWDMDYNDGEVRCRLTTDLFLGALSEGLVELVFRAVVIYSDAFAPYLAAVMTRAMTPEFAADQAMAAIENAYREASK